MRNSIDGPKFSPNSGDGNGGVVNAENNLESKLEMVPLTKVEPFYNSTFMKLHIDGKLTLAEDRTGPISFEDPDLKQFANMYKGKNWPLFLQVAMHPDIQKEWKPDSFNSINGKYPRIFVHRQFTGETPHLFASQDDHVGIPIDDLAVESLPDTFDNMLIHTSNRLTEGDIDNNFLLKSIPPHKILDLRSLDISLKNFGPAINEMSITDPEAFRVALSKSQFNKHNFEKIVNMMQDDPALKNQIALLIVNDNSAFVIDSSYLIDIETKKSSLKTEDLGHTPIPENIKFSNSFFENNDIPENVTNFLNELVKMNKVYGTYLTELQEKKLDNNFVNFIKDRNGLVYDRVFEVLYNKISLLKQLPADKLSIKQTDFINKADELYKESLDLFRDQEEKYIKFYKDEFNEEFPEDEKSSLHMQVFKDTLESLIEELNKVNKLD